ncbi:fluoride efflux transporter CrcB [Arhodomonas sp. SL1]|uniref:fluoride efflux transporter CrcB n=1 Tax=Arhodomonas sp. SL1 TaxID=3425691 RepID=UPI003F882DB7
MWVEASAVAVGGAAGAVLRFLLTRGMTYWLGHGFPWGTLAVNVLGSLLLGVLFVIAVERGGVPLLWRAGLMVGLFGAFTTFSTFSVDTMVLLEDGAPVRALANVLANVTACLIAAWVGLRLARVL